MATHVERVPARRAPTGVWIVIGAVIVLLAAIGGGVLIGRATVEEAAPPSQPLDGALVEETAPPETLGLAPARFVAAIDANIAALNAADEEAYAATWAQDGVFTRGELEVAGIDQIIVATWPAPAYPGEREFGRTSEVIFIPRTPGPQVFENGPYAAHAFSCGTANLKPPGIAVYQFGDQLKIVHQWVISPSRKWVGSCFGTA